MKRPPLPLGTGWVRDLPDHRDYPYRANFDNLPPVIPTKLELQWVPLAVNQFGVGSCMANAVLSAEHFCRIKQQMPESFLASRLFLYYNARAMRGWETFDSGSFIRDGIKSLADDGVCPEDMWPYNTTNVTVKPSQECYDAATKYKSIQYRRLGVDQPILDDIRHCLIEGFPVVFGASLYENFPWDGRDGGAVPMPSGSLIAGHAMLLFGFNDETRRCAMLNSWGDIWGHNGRGLFPYDYLSDLGLCADFWTINLVN